MGLSFQVLRCCQGIHTKNFATCTHGLTQKLQSLKFPVCGQAPPEDNMETGVCSHIDEREFSCGREARGNRQTGNVSPTPFVGALHAEYVIAPYRVPKSNAGNGSAEDGSLTTFCHSLDVSDGEGGYQWSVKSANKNSGQHQRESGSHSQSHAQGTCDNASNSPCIFCGGTIEAGIGGENACSCLCSLDRKHGRALLEALDAQAASAPSLTQNSGSSLSSREVGEAPASRQHSISITPLATNDEGGLDPS